MKPRLAIILVILVLTPLVLMAWLGVYLVGNERATLEESFRRLHHDKLQDLETLIQKVIAERERRLINLAEKLQADNRAIRALVRNTPATRQIFLLDEQGRLFHPPPAGPLSQQERDFLSRAAQLLEDRSLFFGPAAERSGPADHGWYSWYWGSGLNLVFWQRTKNGMIAGFELDRFRLLADIIAELPVADEAPADSRISLLDSRDSVLYGWGDYQPPEGSAPVADLAIGKPLKPWRLAYHTSATAAGDLAGSGTLLLLISSLAALGLVLVGLAVYFYRSSSRELREAGQRVSFVNHVSHELKTPLTNIRMYAELLTDTLDTEDERSARYLDVVVSESQRLSRLIDNVLTFGRHRRGVLKLRRKPAVVDEVLSRLIEYFEPGLSEKGVAVDFEPGAPARVLVDGDALEQIMSNLISNVEKYAATGDRLEISTTQNKGLTRVRVADDGPGIPAGEREHIFEPFVRLGSKVTEGSAGTGIGLAIARELARLHGGDLILKPSSDGALFELTLATARED